MTVVDEDDATTRAELEELAFMTLLGTSAAAYSQNHQKPDRVVTIADCMIDPLYHLGVHKSDNDVIVLMVARCLAQTKPGSLKMISQYFRAIALLRDSETLTKAQTVFHELAKERETYESACSVLEVLPESDDEVVKAQFIRLIQQSPDLREDLMAMLRIIVGFRKDSTVLNELLETYSQHTPDTPLNLQADPSRVVSPPYHDRNPHHRVREENMPTGLVNCLNVCYFNSLVQAYFSIPAIRDIVMQFRSHTGPSPAAQQFMLNLQMLFAFMQDTRRKYVSPITAATSLVRTHALVGQQQDVHECNGWLLEYIEKCLAGDGCPTAPIFKRYVDVNALLRF